MRITCIVMFVVICSFAYSEALKCAKCDVEKYCHEDLSLCKWGTSKDACRCCDVCSKGLGEPCGGAFIINGRCGTNLVCEVNTTSSDFPGRCIKATPTY
ncbi:hypothetical protein CHUAL_009959 [Chamberlinius hualienensis]